MTLNSKYFDSLRVGASTKGRKKQPAVEQHPPCQWKGCDKPGAHKAPMGRGADGQYFQFCVDHVRKYNATYNYFDGMSDDAVEKFQKETITGNRPTWRMANRAKSLPRDRYAVAEDARAAREAAANGAPQPADPHGIFTRRSRASTQQGEPVERHVRKLEKKALASLNLDGKATKVEIKARFKLLAKRYHPDGNGGDRGAEEKLREVLQAYNYLKQAGHV